jgi:hypothetical protein
VLHPRGMFDTTDLGRIDAAKSTSKEIERRPPAP